MNLKKASKFFALFSLYLAVYAGAFYFAGYRINTTKSIPQGVYKIVSGQAEKGDYVLFCPPATAIFAEAKERGYIGIGFCEGGTGLLMKKILAAKNDVVTSGVNGVFVDGEKIINSKPLEADSHGNKMEIYEVVNLKLNNKQVLLMSDISAKSFDARYFGVIERSHIKSKIRPVLTW